MIDPNGVIKKVKINKFVTNSGTVWCIIVSVYI